MSTSASREPWADGTKEEEDDDDVEALAPQDLHDWWSEMSGAGRILCIACMSPGYRLLMGSVDTSFIIVKEHIFAQREHMCRG